MNEGTLIDGEGVTAILNAGTALSRPRENPHPESDGYAIIPDAHKLEYLKRAELPFRRQGITVMHDLASFLHQWETLAPLDSARVYGSLDPAQFVAVLNDYPEKKADTGTTAWRDHRIVFPLIHSKEWIEWTKRSGQPFEGNENFATWLENNLPDVIEGGRLMDVALNIRVKQNQTFGNAVRLQDGNINLNFQNEVVGEGGTPRQTGESVQIPEAFKISIPVWQGLDSQKYEVDARFRYRLSGGVLRLRYELVRPHKIVDQSFLDLLKVIEEKCGKVLFGLPDAK
jgi:Uncharacterized conserved protein (DUF2303).